MIDRLRKTNILITGGAGYVGSVVAEELLSRGYRVTVVDNLQQGHREAVLPGVELIVGDIRDEAFIDGVFGRSGIDAVVHMAADSIVGRSMSDPRECFRNNVGGGMNLLNGMVEHGVPNIVFSSSAAIYGEPRGIPIDEDHPCDPVNTYGDSKYMFERILSRYGMAYGIKHVSLRYFNAAGASERLGEDHRPETHLIPNVLQAAIDRARVTVYGNDYPTDDGSCIRDYVHIVDIAQAHVLTLEKLGDLSGSAYNLGSGRGYSVTEVIEAARRITGVDIPINIAPRRAGDPAILVASCELAKKEIGWRPEFDRIEDIIGSAWRWKQEHPAGYGD